MAVGVFTEFNHLQLYCHVRCRLISRLGAFFRLRDCECDKHKVAHILCALGEIWCCGYLREWKAGVVTVLNEVWLAEDHDLCRFVFGCVKLDKMHGLVRKYGGEEARRTWRLIPSTAPS